MAISDLDSGKRQAVVEARGVRENQRLEGTPLEAWARFKVNEDTAIEWTGLLMTRAGERNSKTFRCLKALGCDGDVVKWLNDPVQETPVQLTIVDKPSKDGTKTFKVVDWVNPIGSGQAPSDEDQADIIAKLKSAGLGGDEIPF